MSEFHEELSEAMERRGWKPIHLAAAMASRHVDVAPITVEKWMEGTHEPRYTHGRLALSILNEDLAGASLGDATVGELCDAIVAQGECFEHLGEIYRDGVVDHDECEAGCAAIDESIRALLALKQKLAADVHPECRTLAEAVKRGMRGNA